jgi:hypothetical protein
MTNVINTQIHHHCLLQTFEKHINQCTLPHSREQKYTSLATLNTGQICNFHFFKDIDFFLEAPSPDDRPLSYINIKMFMSV